MTKQAQTHYSEDSKTAACGSTSDPNWFSPVPDEVTCKRCQKSYIYMEKVDSLTRPEGAAPRFTRPAYAISKEQPSLRNAKVQVIEEATEKEPVYELSYTIVSHKVKQWELLDVMETLINQKATNIKVIQIG